MSIRSCTPKRKKKMPIEDHITLTPQCCSRVFERHKNTFEIHNPVRTVRTYKNKRVKRNDRKEKPLKEEKTIEKSTLFLPPIIGKPPNHITSRRKHFLFSFPHSFFYRFSV